MSASNGTGAVEAVSFERAFSDLQQGVSAASSASSEASARMMKTGKDVASFNQGTYEAFVQAGQTYANGAQEMMKQMAESARAAYAEALNGIRAIVTAKTPKERIELQVNFVRSSALWSISETSRFAHSSVDLAERVYAPITARAIVAAEWMSKQSR